MKTINKSKIEWCDYTFNPVWGCKNNCLYCYAKKINERFKKIENWNKPEWIESNFNKEFPKKSSNIYVNSMSDLVYWNPDWILRVIEKIENNPQHNFLFLTKNPLIYDVFSFPGNCWLGMTVTNNASHHKAKQIFTYIDLKNKTFISIEPIQEYINLPFNCYYETFDWFILGMETGNRKNKIIPDLSWIKKIVNFCKTNKKPLFMKNNLKSIWKDDLIQEFPKELKNG